ncbi:MAG: hypothetical protein WDW38_000230 [Sanguina aurantia]
MKPLSSTALQSATAASDAAASLRTQTRLELQGEASGSPDSPDTRTKEVAWAASCPVGQSLPSSPPTLPPTLPAAAAAAAAAVTAANSRPDASLPTAAPAHSCAESLHTSSSAAPAAPLAAAPATAAAAAAATAAAATAPRSRPASGPTSPHRPTSASHHTPHAPLQSLLLALTLLAAACLPSSILACPSSSPTLVNNGLLNNRCPSHRFMNATSVCTFNVFCYGPTLNTLQFTAIDMSVCLSHSIDVNPSTGVAFCASDNPFPPPVPSPPPTPPPPRSPPPTPPPQLLCHPSAHHPAPPIPTVSLPAAPEPTPTHTAWSAHTVSAPPSAEPTATLAATAVPTASQPTSSNSSIAQPPANTQPPTHDASLHHGQLPALGPNHPAQAQLDSISQSLAALTMLPVGSTNASIQAGFATAVYMLTPSSLRRRQLSSCQTCTATLEVALQAALCAQLFLSNCSTVIVECVKTFQTQQVVHFIPQCDALSRTCGMQLAAQFQLGNYDNTAFLLGLLSSSLSVTGYTVADPVASCIGRSAGLSILFHNTLSTPISVQSSDVQSQVALQLGLPISQVITTSYFVTTPTASSSCSRSPRLGKLCGPSASAGIAGIVLGLTVVVALVGGAFYYNTVRVNKVVTVNDFNWARKYSHIIPNTNVVNASPYLASNQVYDPYINRGTAVYR